MKDEPTPANARGRDGSRRGSSVLYASPEPQLQRWSLRLGITRSYLFWMPRKSLMKTRPLTPEPTCLELDHRRRCRLQAWGQQMHAMHHSLLPCLPGACGVGRVGRRCRGAVTQNEICSVVALGVRSSETPVLPDAEFREFQVLNPQQVL